MSKKEGNIVSSKINVPPEFQAIFSHFYYARNTALQSVTKTLLPTFQTLLIFNFGDRLKISAPQGATIYIEQCLILGPIKQGIRYTLPPQTEMFVVNFIGDAFFRFFGQILASDGLSAHPDSWLEENCFADLWKTLRELENPEKRVNGILKFCRPYLGQPNEIAEQLVRTDKKNDDPIKRVAQKRKLSRRHVQQIHKSHLGYSAKAFARYQRFLKVIEILQGFAQDSAKVDWFDIIVQCGYYDQSHLIRDFKHFMHLSPTQYLNYQQEICNPLR